MYGTFKLPAAMGPSTSHQKVVDKEKVENKRLVDMNHYTLMYVFNCILRHMTRKTSS